METTQDKFKKPQSTIRKWVDKAPTNQSLYYGLLGIVGLFVIPFVFTHLEHLGATIPTNGHHIWTIVAMIGALMSISAAFDILGKTTKGANFLMFKLTDNKRGAQILSSIPQYAYYGYCGYLIIKSYL